MLPLLLPSLYMLLDINTKEIDMKDEKKISTDTLLRIALWIYLVESALSLFYAMILAV